MDWMKLVHGEDKPTLPAFKPGDRVRVWYRIAEQGKERLGQFEGDVIRARGSGPSRTFTVRRVTFGEGVERVFPFDCKSIARIEVLTQGKVHRSRLYYLRRVIGKTRIAVADDAADAVSASANPKTTANAQSAAGRTEPPAAEPRQPASRATAAS